MEVEYHEEVEGVEEARWAAVEGLGHSPNAGD